VLVAGNLTPLGIDDKSYLLIKLWRCDELRFRWPDFSPDDVSERLASPGYFLNEFQFADSMCLPEFFPGSCVGLDKYCKSRSWMKCDLIHVNVLSEPNYSVNAGATLCCSCEAPGFQLRKSDLRRIKYTMREITSVLVYNGLTSLAMHELRSCPLSRNASKTSVTLRI
jgi:hypothetical protein